MKDFEKDFKNMLEDSFKEFSETAHIDKLSRNDQKLIRNVFNAAFGHGYKKAILYNKEKGHRK